MDPAPQSLATGRAGRHLQPGHRSRPGRAPGGGEAGRRPAGAGSDAAGSGPDRAADARSLLAGGPPPAESSRWGGVRGTVDRRIEPGSRVLATPVWSVHRERSDIGPRPAEARSPAEAHAVAVRHKRDTGQWTNLDSCPLVVIYGTQRDTGVGPTETRVTLLFSPAQTAPSVWSVPPSGDVGAEPADARTRRRPNPQTPDPSTGPT